MSIASVNLILEASDPKGSLPVLQIIRVWRMHTVAAANNEGKDEGKWTEKLRITAARNNGISYSKC
jgi:hypothetical protein